MENLKKTHTESAISLSLTVSHRAFPDILIVIGRGWMRLSSEFEESLGSHQIWEPVYKMFILW